MAKEFQRDLAIELRVPRVVDLAERAGADSLEQAE
jgi:hypothetical protein